MKKLLVVGVIILFLGLAVAPSINANISRASIDSELVEITTEVCGLNGGKRTVKLTQEESGEVEALFDSIRERLNATETREEAEEIFNEAVVELDKYGLLGGLRVEDAQRLVTGGHQDTRVMNTIEKMSKRDSVTTDYELSRCLVIGRAMFAGTIFSLSLPFAVVSMVLLFFYAITHFSQDLLIDICSVLVGITIILSIIRNILPGPQLPCFLATLSPPIPFGGTALIASSTRTEIIPAEEFYSLSMYGFTGLRFWLPLNHFFIGFAPEIHVIFWSQIP